MLGYSSLESGDPRMEGPFEQYPTDLKQKKSSPDDDDAAKAKTARPSLPIALAIATAILPICLCGAYGNPKWAGGFNFNAAAYAIWNEMSFMLIGPALMDYLQTYFNRPSKSWLWDSRYCFAVFLIHPALSAAIQLAIDKLFLGVPGLLAAFEGPILDVVGPILLTSAASWLNAVASFAVARWVLEGFPLLKTIL